MLAHFDYIRMNYERKDFPYRIDVTRQLLLVLCHEIAAIYQNGEQAAIPSDTYQEKLFRKFIRLRELYFPPQLELLGLVLIS